MLVLDENALIWWTDDFSSKRELFWYQYGNVLNQELFNDMIIMMNNYRKKFGITTKENQVYIDGKSNIVIIR